MQASAKRQTSKLLFAACFLSGATAVQASDWRRFGSTAAGDTVLLDAANVVQTNGEVYVWEKFASADGSVVLQRVIFECSMGTYAVQSEIKYDAKGAVISSRTLDGLSMTWGPVPPDSIAESASALVCRKPSP